jgi:excisionase family DNA binding protein
MTLEEVAEYLRVKPQTIYTWAQKKKMPATKPGKE